MLKFTVVNNKVIPDTTLHMISEFTDILEYGDKKKDKDLAGKMLLYVFYCCDLTQDNPFKDVDYRKKEEQAKNRLFPKKKFTKKERELLDAAIDAYNFFNETALERAALAYDKKIDEVRELLESTAPSTNPVTDAESGEVIKYVSNAADLEKFAKLVKDMANYKLNAMETAKKIENTGRVRGGKGSSMIERGAFRRDNKR